MIGSITYLNFESPVHILNKYQNDPNLKAYLKENMAVVYSDSGLEDRIDEMIEERRQQAGSKQQGLLEFIQDPSGKVRFYSALAACLFQQISGINLFVFFSNDFFNQLSGNGKTISVIFGVGNFLGSFLAQYLVTRLSRVDTFKYGLFVQGLSMFAILTGAATGMYFIFPIAVLTYIVAYAVGVGAVVGLYVCEILPATVAGICFGILWIAASLSGKVFPFFIEHFGGQATLGIFGTVCLCSSAYAGKFLYDNMAGVQIEKQPVQETREKLLTELN